MCDSVPRYSSRDHRSCITRIRQCENEYALAYTLRSGKTVLTRQRTGRTTAWGLGKQGCRVRRCVLAQSQPNMPVVLPSLPAGAADVRPQVRMLLSGHGDEDRDWWTKLKRLLIA